MTKIFLPITLLLLLTAAFPFLLTSMGAPLLPANLRSEMTGPTPYSGNSGIYKFDMGSEDSPLWEGFTKVRKDTVYTKERGYGWKEPASLEIYTKALGSNLPNPDALCADFVAPGRHLWGNNYNLEGKIEFKLDLANDEYKVHLLMGEFLGLSERYSTLIKSWKVKAEGKKVLSCHIDKKDSLSIYYRHLNDEYHRNQDIWRKYVVPRFKPRTFRVRVEDGQLNIVFENRSVNMMIIYPLSQAVQIEQWLENLNQERKRRFPFKLTKREDKGFGPLIVTDEEKDRGYVVYVPDYMDDIYPEDIPRPEWKGNTIEIFAGQGEYEPGVFCIYPLRGLKGCKCEITDLVSEHGGKIEKENIDLRMVRYWEAVTHEGSSHAKPWFLVRRDCMDMEAGINREYWLTLKVPEDAEAGEYEGKVRFKPENAPAEELTLKARILPFQLKEPENKYYYLQYNFFGVHPTATRNAMRARYKNMVEHGFNVDLCPRPIKIDITKDGNVRVDFRRFKKILHHWAEEYGWRPKILVTMDMGIRKVYQYLKQPVPRLRGAKEKPVFSNQFDNLFKKVMRKVVEELMGHPDWPEVVFLYVTAEGGGTPETMAAARHLLKLAKEAGCTTASGLTQMIAAEKTPYLQIPYVCKSFCTERVIGRIRELMGNDPRIWGYYIGTNRLERGFFFFKSGFECLVMEGGMVANGAPYNPYDDAYRCWGHVWPSPDGLVPTLWWERAREGIDDYKYINHVNILINRAENSKRPEAIQSANEAEQLVKEIMERIVLNVNYYRNPEARGGIWAKYHWPNSLYRKYRLQLAEEIIKLQEVLQN